ncbi:MAG: hypothetical protein AAFO82_14730, partial [Bacteroidota bacterium]
CSIFSLLLLNCTNSSIEERNQPSIESYDKAQTVPEKFIDLDSALIMHPDSIYKLYLGGSGLKSIPKVVFTFRNLRALNIARNSKIEELDDFIWSLFIMEYF